jgi:hypothetical protein
MGILEVTSLRVFSFALDCVLLTTACGAKNDGTADADRRGTTMDSHSGKGSADRKNSIPPVGEAGTGLVLAGGFPSLAGETAHLVDVRVAGHDGFDRVVLEFDETTMPSYRVAYVEPPIRGDGSGEVVDLPGKAFLELRLTPATAWDLSGGDPRRTYSGPSRVAPPFEKVITEAARTGDFELTLAWTVGLTHRAPFAVAVFHDPLRLVVDVLHEHAER